ncbi:Uncharacterised protein [Zhongshania aliphaticivorans]|uniref:Flagellar biosynthesis protein n=1 Tax=Zhongshania aliphaticivorans TaxID=1470434 RepID=A0A5S9PHS8_9GAMM|nr:YajG family lipoprotein [Zhongshania aliphaticivorans]CAA0103550.1 Uncharacterised protein [Zhongshania aliphaticivorans]CAA0113429.1 Uncharacterised protein [Zhongshania aliphaticivorans]
MKKLQIALLMATLVLTGCVAGTRNIDLVTPDYNNENSASGDVYIVAINDKRTFEQKPRNPSTPSVDGNLSSTSKEKLSTLIGRQRNGYGMAMGDVALNEGLTIQDEVRELLTKGLESRGYKVVDNVSAPNHLTVDVEKFWAWFSPGMWSVSFESNLQCNIGFKKGMDIKQIDITGYGINKGQIASDENWKLAYRRAYLNFLENLDKLLDAEDL